MTKFPIYMDYHATTPLDPRVLDSMMPYFTEDFGNAASIDHIFGNRASQAVEGARKSIARHIGARAEEEIIFTSGATESNNLAIVGVANMYKDKGNHIITCTTEHHAVLDVIKHLTSQGFETTILPVDKYGQVELDSLKEAITDRTILISIMTANNEIGTIHPVEQIGKVAQEHDILFHTDATQAVGHIPMNVQQMNIHLMSFSAHKLCGPKGVGALYVRRRYPRVKLSPIFFGGGHERGFRSGTLNVPGIIGFATALDIAIKEMDTEQGRLFSWTEQMLRQFQKNMEGIERNGHPILKLAHNLNVFVPGIEAKALILELKNIVAISAGSACTSSTVEPSHVIRALGYDEVRSHNSVRFGLGRWTTDEEVQQVTASFVEAVKTICSRFGKSRVTVE